MAGYTPDEKLRLEQLRALRRRWLKDQELSPREPVQPPEKLGPIARFWRRFLEPGSPWRNYIFKASHNGVFIFTRMLIPAWFVHYYVKYHLMEKPYAIVNTKLRIYPGDTVIETGEVMPEFEEDSHGPH